MKNSRNVVGPRIKKLRLKQGLSRNQLASRCRKLGWKVSKQTLASIEDRARRLTDVELFCIAKALRVSLSELG